VEHIRCVHCGYNNRAHVNFCENCGNVLSARPPDTSNTQRHCSRCGTILRLGVQFCENCGTHISNVEHILPHQTSPPRKSSQSSWLWLFTFIGIAIFAFWIFLEQNNTQHISRNPPPVTEYVNTATPTTSKPENTVVRKAPTTTKVIVAPTTAPTKTATPPVSSDESPPPLDTQIYYAQLNSIVTNLHVFWSLKFKEIFPEFFYQLVEVTEYFPPTEIAACAISDFDPNQTNSRENAFFCPATFSVFFDGAWYQNEYQKYGLIFPTYLFAHEFGHAVQYLTDDNSGRSINKEAQADCYAGAYFKFAYEKEYLSEEDINTTFWMIPNELAETSFTWTGTNAHGGGLRMGFFLNGYDNGVEYCKDFKVYTK